jgi:hypothetical protein
LADSEEGQASSIYMRHGHSGKLIKRVKPKEEEKQRRREIE